MEGESRPNRSAGRSLILPPHWRPNCAKRWECAASPRFRSARPAKSAGMPRTPNASRHPMAPARSQGLRRGTSAARDESALPSPAEIPPRPIRTHRWIGRPFSVALPGWPKMRVRCSPGRARSRWSRQDTPARSRSALLLYRESKDDGVLVGLARFQHD